MSASLRNEGTPGLPWTPRQPIPSGTALEPSADTPKLFTPIKIRNLTFQNRVMVAPMCMYTAQDGHLTDFHIMHLGGLAYRGAPLTIVEATGVTPEGRISPEDSGLWKDSQIEPLKRVADFVHGQGQKVGIQLAHAGRKASTVAPFLTNWKKTVVATPELGGWGGDGGDVVGPSNDKWDPSHSSVSELTVEGIQRIVKGFGDAAARAIKAGVDVIEIHSAHGYLLHEFLSQAVNKRSDSYGGSFENRTKFLLEVIKSIRDSIPEETPLFVRISATDWLDGESWNMEQSIRLALLLPAAGVDLLDVSSGGNSPNQKIGMHSNYQIDMAAQIREVVRRNNLPLLIGAVGFITEAKLANEIIESGKADVVLLAREFLRQPEWVLKSAFELGVQVSWPQQYGRAPFRAAKV